MHSLRRLAVPPLFLALAGCFAPIRVHESSADLPPPAVLDEATLKEAAAFRRDGDRLKHDLAETLAALRVAAKRAGAGDENALPEYNFLTARLIDQLIAADLRPWHQSLRLDIDGTDQVLRGNQPADLARMPRRFTTVDRLDFSGKYARESAVQPGLGAPLVAFLPVQPHEDNLYKGSVRYRALTAVVRFEGDDAVVDLVDPYETSTVTLGGRRFPLHANYGAHIAYGLSKERIDKLGLARLLNPGRYDDTSALVALQPYDPQRIPVLFVHGLQDTPASFAPMYFELIRDPKIREHYQFWVFSYPSGYPYPMPAAQLRRELDRVAAQHPGHKDIVLVGHSMGGLISRLMVTDADDRIWRAYFGKPPEETRLSGFSRELLEEAMVFDSRKDVSRAVFIAAPHRGSELASNWIGRLATKLVRLPGTLAEVRDTFVNIVALDSAALELNRAPNSIDTLSPKNPFLLEVDKLPIDPRIPYHSIMGDRGFGESDGVVPYWSSHLEGAVSEKTVPSFHMAHQNEEAIEEMRRILYLHAGLGRPSRSRPR